jgi:Cft2 family RNA processing exonuclease
MKFSKRTELLLLFVVLVFFINFLFYRYVYSNFVIKTNRLKSQISSVNSDISSQINLYYNNMKIFDKISSVKQQIKKTEENLILLKTKVKTDIQISEIIKSLIKESGIKVHKLTLVDKKQEKNNKIYTFDVYVSGNLDNLVKLLDKIDNKNELLKINSYNIKVNENTYDMNIKISSIYQEIDS